MVYFFAFDFMNCNLCDLIYLSLGLSVCQLLSQILNLHLSMENLFVVLLIRLNG